MQLERLGKYQIVAKIGQGAMGNVHRAHDPILSRDVAIKTMSAGVGADDDLRRRFLREAQSAARLNHPNIITIYDFGEEQGHLYIAMELLEGADLKEVINRKRPMSLEAKLDLVDQICDGLAFAHANGVIHRDLKPANIHLQPNGQVKIVDFGLARVTSSSQLTAVGTMLGTPNYMSPEQVRGEKASTRSDVFALGAVFYELLSGGKAFDAETMAGVLFQVMQADPPPLDSIRPELGPIAVRIQRAMMKDPARRFADAGELRDALRDARRAPAPDLPRALRPPPRPASPLMTPSLAGTLVRRAEESAPPEGPGATVVQAVVTDSTPLPAITKRSAPTVPPVRPRLLEATQETGAEPVSPTVTVPASVPTLPPHGVPYPPPGPTLATPPRGRAESPWVAPRPVVPAPFPVWVLGVGAMALAGVGFFGYVILARPGAPASSTSLAPSAAPTVPASLAVAPTPTLTPTLIPTATPTATPSPAYTLPPATRPPVTLPPRTTPLPPASTPPGPSLADVEHRLAEKDFRGAVTAARAILERDGRVEGARRALDEAERQIRTGDELATRVRIALDANDAEKASQAFSQLLAQDPRRADTAALAARLGEVMKTRRIVPPVTAPPPPVVATTLPPPPTTVGTHQSEAAARQAIRGVLDEYRAAFERRDADALRNVQPGIDYEAMRKTFASVTGYTVRMDIKEVTVSGNEGLVTSVVTYMPQPKPSQKIPPQATVFHLRRTGDVWRIESLERK